MGILLKKVYDLDGLRDALAEGERIRLGGKFGAPAFFALAWSSAAIIIANIAVYTWTGMSSLPNVFGIAIHLGEGLVKANMILDIVIGLLWVIYIVALFLYKNSIYSESDLGWKVLSSPNPTFLLKTGEEKASFLRLIGEHCPMLETNDFRFGGFVFRVILTILVSVSKYLYKSRGLLHGIIPILDFGAALALLYLLY